MSEQIELTCDAVISRLQTQLTDYIDNLNLAATDPYVLEYPALISFGTRSEMPYPAVLVLPKRTETTMDNGMRMHFNHRISVTAWLAEADEEGLARKLVRYQRAIRECILSRRELDDGSGYGLQHDDDEYGPVFNNRARGQFISWAESVYMVQQQQTLIGG
jgi:hypothetical protein